MEKFLEILLGGANLLGPIIVAMLTVPLMGWLKRVAGWIDGLAAGFQQILVVLIAAGLTWLGATLNVVIPVDLALFAEADVSALLSAAMAYGIHAGKKAGTSSDIW